MTSIEQAARSIRDRHDDGSVGVGECYHCGQAWECSDYRDAGLVLERASEATEHLEAALVELGKHRRWKGQDAQVHDANVEIVAALGLLRGAKENT